MKTFNKVLQVSISVDTIAQKLLSTFPADYAHKDALTETIIATALDKGTLEYIYNSLNGFSNNVDFQVGQEVICTENAYVYQPDQGDNDYGPIGRCKIVEIDPYSIRKLRVEFAYKAKSSKSGIEQPPVTTNTEWVNHTECSGLPSLAL